MKPSGKSSADSDSYGRDSYRGPQDAEKSFYFRHVVPRKNGFLIKPHTAHRSHSVLLSKIKKNKKH